MRCKTPITIRHPTYRSEFIEVPCGKCLLCKSEYSDEWALRMNLEEKYSPNYTYFVTLTYEDSYLPLSNLSFLPTLVKSDIQKFLKRFRKFFLPGTIRYYAAGEYSPVGRPHYHLLLFNVPYEQVQTYKIVKKCWTFGIIDVQKSDGYCSKYITKYVCKIDDKDTYEKNQIQKPFNLKSQGLGYGYIENFNNYKYHQDTLNTFITLNGYKHKLPRYFKEKLFNEDQLQTIRIRSLIYLQHQRDREQDELYNCAIKGINDASRKQSYLEDNSRRIRNSVKGR